MCVIEQIVVKYKNLFHFRMFSTILAIFLLQIYTLLTIYLKKTFAFKVLTVFLLKEVQHNSDYLFLLIFPASMYQLYFSEYN